MHVDQLISTTIEDRSVEDTIQLEQKDEVFIKVHCDAGTAMELSEFFTFKVPGHQFTPAYKNKMWDGNIRLFNVNTRLIYAGLRPHIEQFAEERGYDIEHLSEFSDREFSLSEANAFIAALEPTLQPRDYQVTAFAHAIRTGRALLVSPTGSGKSFIQYLITMYFQSLFLTAKKTLIIVPTTGLVHQMTSDFEDYGLDAKYMHSIYSGEDKDTSRPIVITTWQSIFKMPKKWFDQFGCVMVDECHLAKAQSLTSILTKMENCAYRFGFTGSLDGSQTHALVIQGLLGPIKKVATTAGLIEQKHLASFQIKAIVLKYSEETRKTCKNLSYPDEMDFIVRNPNRNRLLSNLALSLTGNTLLLFQYVEKHGKLLYDIIKAAAGSRSVYFVHGGVDGQERDDIRGLVEQEADAIIIASAGTFSTGVNIKNLHNIIFASPSKSKIRNLQSIGRGLRKSDSKQQAVLYDIADDLSWKTQKNYTLLHFAKRVELYNEEKFPYKIYSVQLKE